MIFRGISRCSFIREENYGNYSGCLSVWSSVLPVYDCYTTDIDVQAKWYHWRGVYEVTWVL